MTWTGLKEEMTVLKLWLHHRDDLEECITPLLPMFTMHRLDSELKASAVYRLAS